MFDWIAYLVLADELAGRSDEASQRSAISRAYYAVFCSFRNRLKDKGESFSQTGKDHKKVWDKLQDMEHRRISELGNRLRKARGDADYKDHIPKLSKRVKGAMVNARNILSELNDI